MDRRSPLWLKKDEDRLSSPKNHCPICLGDVINKSFTNSCLHEFCFLCLREWSKIKTECPLCKQEFNTIYHNIRANESYGEYKIQTPSDIFPALRTLNLILRPPAEIYTRRNASNVHFPSRRNGEEGPSRVEIRENTLSDLRRRIISEDLWSRHNFNLHTRENSLTEIRRRIYRENLWSRPNTLHRQRESHPKFYTENPARIHRLTPWLFRELSILLDHASHVPALVSQIENLITTHLILSDHFHDALSPYLGECTAHFIHEFYNFAISPYDLPLHDHRESYYNPSEISRTVPTLREVVNLFSCPGSDEQYSKNLPLRIFELPPSPKVSEIAPTSPIVIDLVSESEDEVPDSPLVVGESNISDTDDDIEIVDEVIPKPDVICISSCSDDEYDCPCPKNDKCPYRYPLLRVMRSKQKCSATCRRANLINSDSSQTLTSHPSDSDCDIVRVEDSNRKMKKLRKRLRRSPQPSSSRFKSSRRTRPDSPMPSTSRAPSVSSYNSDSDST